MATAKINLFEYAVRAKVRFMTVRGAITVEQLWEAPLRSNDGFDLNTIAKAINKTVKEHAEENFVDVGRKPDQVRAERMLDMVKHIIEVKMDEETRAEQRVQNRAERAKLLKIIEEKQDGALSDLSINALKKRYEELSDEETA